ncbi:restriction endonuclease subunit S [Vibrio diabolicus]|uniref:restriction endonuclease subunit S n=1 Tax=Vibrio diabolicus TaxID=50719 RepID=UPI00211B0FB0|nr:restriction endonuclease subunit S [Vibrio diabolicus]
MDNWRDSKIEELCTLHYGKSPKGIDSDDGIYPIYGTGGIVGSTNNYLYDQPSIILGRKGSIGNIHYVNKPFWTIDTTFYVEAKNCDTKWLYYVFSSLNIEKLNEATGVPSLSRNNIYAQMLKAPSDQKEQQKIAEILSTVDKKIDLIDQKIAETEKLKTGLMQKLFSEGIGVQDENGNWQPHTEFRTTSIGQVPKTWQDAQIGDYVSELVSGVSVNSYDKQKTENEIGVLKTSAVIGGNFYPEFHKTVKPEDIARAKTTVKENTLVISRMNTPSLVGEFGYVSKDYNDLYLPDRLWMTVPTSKPHDVKALSYLMQHYPVKKSIKELATGTSNSMKNISKGKFLAVYVPHIPYEEQMMIREILSTVDIKLELLNKQKAETQQLKKGLMQKLLTGEWRVPVEETEAA